PPLHCDVDFIGKNLNERQPAPHGPASGVGQTTPQPGTVLVRNPLQALFCEHIRGWAQTESNQISQLDRFWWWLEAEQRR
ncbi:MAG: hypothetical protein ACRD3W_20935, partial [Terriglobales bacterium]